jgi:hypothetical protein
VVDNADNICEVSEDFDQCILVDIPREVKDLGAIANLSDPSLEFVVGRQNILRWVIRVDE